MQSETPANHDIPEYVGSTLSFGDIDEVLLICHDLEAPSAKDWSMLLKRLRSADYRVVLVSTEGGGPNHVQLEALMHVLNTDQLVQPPVAVLSASPRMRWSHAVRQLISAELVALTLPYEAIARARRLLEFSPSADRVQLARSRAHYLIVKQAVARHVPELH